VLVLGVVRTCIAYVLNYRLTADEGASDASIVTYLIPVVAVLLGYLMPMERMPMNVLAGMLVLIGVALVRSRPGPRPGSSGS
jgi:drug/metabolite transporter (DMT)-like permease